MEGQIVEFLQVADAGLPVIDLCRRHEHVRRQAPQ